MGFFMCLMLYIVKGAYIEEIVALNDELNRLNQDAKELEDVINHNIRHLTGD